jgi:hypothetical protein
MGYTTTFKGELKFTKELTASQLAHLKTFFGEDCRDHPEWDEPDLYYIDLELTEDFSGIRWSGAEKSYGLEKQVSMVVREMRKKWPDFALAGTLSAQGEDAEDRWTLYINDVGMANKAKVPIVGQRVTCPSCEHEFILEDK